MNPALTKARQRAQAAIERDYGGWITVDGISYAAATHLAPAASVLNEQGNWETRQTLKVSVKKSVMRTPPPRRATILHNKISYMVHGEVGGQNEVDVAWIITASRKLPSPS